MTDIRAASKTPILPSKSLAGPALMAVTMVMTFLACLALGSTLLADSAASRWLTRATSAMSIQIVETATQTAEEQAPNVLRQLRDTPGIKQVQTIRKRRPYSFARTMAGSRQYCR